MCNFLDLQFCSDLLGYYCQRITKFFLFVFFFLTVNLVHPSDDDIDEGSSDEDDEVADKTHVHIRYIIILIALVLF